MRISDCGLQEPARASDLLPVFVPQLLLIQLPRRMPRQLLHEIEAPWAFDVGEMFAAIGAELVGELVGFGRVGFLGVRG